MFKSGARPPAKPALRTRRGRPLASSAFIARSAFACPMPVTRILVLRAAFVRLNASLSCFTAKQTSVSDKAFIEDSVADA